MEDLRVGTKGWVITIEVFLLSAIDIAYTENICTSISEAMADLKIPFI